MDFPASTIDELLSGMLDGALSEREARVLARAMVADPTLQNRLDELSHSRTALLKGRSRGRLGPGFACNVVDIARSRAREMGEDAPEWLRSKPVESVRVLELTPKNPESARKVSLRPGLYACALATAAVFVFVFASIPKTEPDGRIAVTPDLELRGSETEKSEQDLISPTELLADNTQPSLARDADGSSSQDTVTKESVAKILSAATEGRLPTTPALVDGKAQADSIAGIKPSNLNQEQVSISSLPKDFFLTLVLDITVDKIALENRALESIFEKYGIVYAEDLVIDADQLKALEDSRLIGSTNADTSEKIGVMFLTSTAEKLSLATTDISDQYKDFPEFTLSMSYDKSAGLLVKQLSGIKFNEEASGVVQRLLPPNSKDNVSSFTTSLRKAGTKRLGKLPLPSNSSELHEKSYLLLLIRSSK